MGLVLDGSGFMWIDPGWSLTRETKREGGLLGQWVVGLVLVLGGLTRSGWPYGYIDQGLQTYVALEHG